MATATHEPYEVSSNFVDFNIEDEFDRDPYTPLLELARKGPVASGRNGEFHGVKVPNNFLFPDQDQDVFLALSYEAFQQVASDHESFSSEKGYGATLRLVFGETLMSMDEPEHGMYKKMILPSFNHRIVTTELVDIAEPIVKSCLADIRSSGRADLVGQFTSVFPYLIIAKLFGVPASMNEEAERLVVASLQMGADPAGAIAAFQGMNDLYQKVVDHHRKNPQDDLTLKLMQTEIDGRMLTDDEVKSFIKQIVAAGLDTTTRQTANLIYLLLENPEQFDDLKANPDLLEAAIWESLRVLSAGGVVPRMATRDTEVCGVKIPEGSGVYGVQHIANLDQARWENPLKFDIRRKRKQLATFGSGVHSCLGVNLALAEMKIAVSTMLESLPNLRKDLALWDQAQIRGFQLRSPTVLPAIWDA